MKWRRFKEKRKVESKVSLLQLLKSGLESRRDVLVFLLFLCSVRENTAAHSLILTVEVEYVKLQISEISQVVG